MILVKYLDTMIIHCSLGFQQINLIQPYHPKASIFPPAHGAVDIPNSHPHRLLLSLKKMSSCSMEIMGQLSFNSIANIIILYISARGSILKNIWWKTCAHKKRIAQLASDFWGVIFYFRWRSKLYLLQPQNMIGLLGLRENICISYPGNLTPKN